MFAWAEKRRIQTGRRVLQTCEGFVLPQVSFLDERSLIYDWNVVDYDINRNPSNHPHGVWFDDETLRDGLQSPSARNPSIEQKIELLGYMEKLGLQKVDLGLPGAGPFHRNHIDAMLSHIKDNDYSIRPGAAVRTLMGDIEPLVEMQAKHEMEIQASAFLGTSPIRQYTEDRKSVV